MGLTKVKTESIQYKFYNRSDLFILKVQYERGKSGLAYL